MLQRVLALALCCFSLCIKDGIAFLASGVRLGSVGEDRSNAIRAQRLGPCDTLWYGIGAMPNRNRYTVSSRPAQKQTQGKGSASNTCLWDTFGEFEVSLPREALRIQCCARKRQGSTDEGLGLHTFTG